MADPLIRYRTCQTDDFSADRITAVMAERWGLVNEICAADDLMARAFALAERIAKHAPLSVQMTKQVIDSSTSHGNATLSQTLEALAGALATTTQDGQEGLASFRERRPPNYTGS